MTEKKPQVIIYINVHSFLPRLASMAAGEPVPYPVPNLPWEQNERFLALKSLGLIS